MCALDTRSLIATERLILREPNVEDAGRIAGLANDYEVASRVSFLPYPYGRADAEAFIAYVREAADEQVFAVEHRYEGLIGMIGFSSKSALGPELGYWLGRDYWGQGYATEAAGAAMRWADRRWRRKVVVAGHFADNPASGEVLIKTGFLYTGEVQSRRSKARGEDAATRMMVWLA